MARARPIKTECNVRKISLSAEELLQALLNLKPSRRVSILDSCGLRPPDGRFLIAAFDPFEVIAARGDHVRITRGSESERLRGDVLGILNERLAGFGASSKVETPVAGACIASFSYELARRFERLRLSSPPSTAFEPDAVLAFYDTLVVHDYLQNSTKIVSCASASKLDEFQESLYAGLSPIQLPDALSSPRAARSNFRRAEYIEAIRRVKEHIAAGDIYQANLTQQLVVPLSNLSPEQIFLKLRRDNPASFSAYLRREDDAVISSSPERFLSVKVKGESRTVEAWPIKGTRPRGRDAVEDGRLRDELERSEKERAENVMIVDLLRNDLGRVSQYGTVSVPELFTVQEHPTLFHLVSKVRATLRKEVEAAELLRATFPCGSITGAPKLRAMEILDEIEGAPRGLSMGAIGYFSFDGSIDLSVAIRTMTVKEGVARFNVGGGLVADSQPEEEYEETLTKARALLRALDAELIRD